MKQGKKPWQFIYDGKRITTNEKKEEIKQKQGQPTLTTLT